LHLDFEQQLSTALSFEADAYFTKIDRFEVEDVYAMSNGVRADLIESFSFTDATEMLGFQSMVDYTLSPRHSVKCGAEVQREKLDQSKFVDNLTGVEDSFVQDPQYQGVTATNYGLFIQDRYTFPNQNTELTTGLRYDVLDLFDNQFSYRLGIVHTYREHYFGKLLHGTAYRTPSFLEFTRAPVGLPRPDVETVATFETQVGHQTKHHRISLTAFYNNYKDVISRQNALFQGSINLDEEQFSNLDEQKIYGIEIEGRLIANKHLDFFANVSIQHGKSEVTDQDIPLLADWAMSVGADYHFSLGPGGLLFHNHFVAYGPREPWPDNVWDAGQQHYFGNRPDDFGDSFFVWYTGVHYTIQQGHAYGLRLSLTVNNLFDEEYYTQHPTVPANDSMAFWDVQYPGRYTSFTVNYAW